MGRNNHAGVKQVLGGRQNTPTKQRINLLPLHDVVNNCKVAV